MKTTVCEVLPGVTLRVVETQRFKTASLNLAFLTPLCEDTASANALVPYLLRRGCRKFPDLAAINFELDLLYGANIEPFVDKQGDVQYVGFSCDGVDGALVGSEQSLTEKLLSMVHDLLLDPLLEEGGFSCDCFESERENLINQILSEKNEKLSYAYRRATAQMFQGQSFGLGELGDVVHARKLTGESVYCAYRTLLQIAPLMITYCGSESADVVSEMVTDVFSDFKRDVVDSIAVSKTSVLDEVKEYCEVLDVAQTVLLIGMRTAADEYTMKVLSAILGGGTASKLFLNVRERASLCYYTGSVFNPRQNSLFFYAGVEDEKAPLAYEKMLDQLKVCADGGITEEELLQAKQVLINQLKITNDTAGALFSYWIDRAVDAAPHTPSETAQAIREVRLQDVIDAANACEVKLVYRLCGKEACRSERTLLPEHQRA